MNLTVTVSESNDLLGRRSPWGELRSSYLFCSSIQVYSFDSILQFPSFFFFSEFLLYYIIYSQSCEP